MQALYDRGYQVNYSEGDRSLNRDFVLYKISVSDRFHVILEGDTLYSIARTYYGFSSLWFLIADANDDVDDIFQLTVGSSIVIPNRSRI